MLIVLCGIAIAVSAGEVDKATSFVQENDENFIIHEAKVSFNIPKQWLTWRRYFALDSAALNRLHSDSTGEWDSTYGSIIDSVLPFTNCLLHIGNDGWGSHSVAWSDVQMRVYLTDKKADEITNYSATRGVEAAKTKKASSVTADSKNESGWQIDHVGFNQWYGDYGGRAGVYFYSRPCGTNNWSLYLCWPTTIRH